MMYPYMILQDEIEVVHSQIIHGNGIDKVLVHFERPTEKGFDDARCELPEYKWIYCHGFSEAEISFFKQFLESNAHLIYKYAKRGGVDIA